MSNFTKDTFFDQIFNKNTMSSNDTSSDDDNMFGTRTLTFGLKKELTKQEGNVSSESDSDLNSENFITMDEDDQGTDDEVQQILDPLKDENVIVNWKYGPETINNYSWEFAYKILNKMKLKEHWVKTKWLWSDTPDNFNYEIIDTLDGAIVYGLVTLINSVTHDLQVYKVVCKIPKETAKEMYQLNIDLPSPEWILRSKWSWLSCTPYVVNNEEAIV